MPGDELTTLEIGGVNYYIPYAYLILKSNPLTEEDQQIYIQTMYPDFSPVTKRFQDLKQANEVHLRIGVLSSFYAAPKKNNRHLNSRLEANRAYKMSGKQYGLIYMTQPEEEDPSWKDIWIEKEGDETRSYIECGESTSRPDLGQCKHRFWLENFNVSVSFRKELLPKWRYIQMKVTELLKSFRNPQHAKEFYRNAISEAEHER